MTDKENSDELPPEVPCLLVPMLGRPWLVPNIVIAEIIPLRQPDRIGNGPEWLVGWLVWRDVEIPLLSFERLNDAGQVHIGAGARIAVINTVGGNSSFYGVIIQGIPRMVKVSQNDVVEESVETGPAEVMNVQVGADLALIPDLDAIERSVMQLA